MSKDQKHQEENSQQKSAIVLWLGVGVVILLVIVTFFGIMMPTPSTTDAGVADAPAPTSQPVSIPAVVAVAPTTQRTMPAVVIPQTPATKREEVKEPPKKKARKRLRRRVASKKRRKRPAKRADGKEEEMGALRSDGRVEPRAAVASDPMRGKEAGLGGTTGKGKTPAELSKATQAGANGDALQRAKVKLVAAAPVKPVAFTLFFRNQIERTQLFRLLEVECFLDGKSLLKSTVDRMPTLRSEVEVLQSTLLPGSYKFKLKVTARGHGLGVFAYRKTFRYHAESVINLEVRAGNAMRVVAEMRDVGGQDEKKRIQVFFLTREK